MNMENLTNDQKEKKRPTFLLVLSILSFTTIGLALLGNLGTLLKGPFNENEMETIMAESLSSLQPFIDSGMDNLSNTIEKILKMQEYINSNFYTHNLVTLLGLIIGLLGVIFMLKSKKTGFHLYIIYNIISVTSIYLSVPAGEVPTIVVITNVIFSGLFIFFYSRNLHWMK